MSDIEVLSSESSSERSEVVSSSEEEDGGDYLELNGNFAPYQGEPLADSEDADMTHDDENEVRSHFAFCFRAAPRETNRSK